MLPLPMSNFAASRRWRRAELPGSLRDDAALDPIRASIERGIAAGRGRYRPSRAVRLRARAIREQARVSMDPKDAVCELLRFVNHYPNVEEFQIIVAQLLAEMD